MGIVMTGSRPFWLLDSELDEAEEDVVEEVSVLVAVDAAPVGLVVIVVDWLRLGEETADWLFCDEMLGMLERRFKRELLFAFVLLVLMSS